MNIYTLENKNHKISFLDYGACLYEWIVKDTNTNILLTNNNLEDYKNRGNGFFGLTVGPIANRIKDGRFNVNGKEYQLEQNENGNTLHSGIGGFWNQTFKVYNYDTEVLEFKLNSSFELDGFPGNKELFVKYTLLENGLRMEYRMSTDEDTPVNITNHAYFNLNGTGDVLDHELFVSADEYLKVDEQNIPIKLDSIKDTFLDFTTKRLISDHKSKFTNNELIDHHYQFNDNKVLKLSNDKLELELTTSYPGIQIYLANFPSGQLLKNGKPYSLHDGIALEPQYEIDAINNKLRDIIVTPNKDYYEWTEYIIKHK